MLPAGARASAGPAGSQQQPRHRAAPRKAISRRPDRRFQFAIARKPDFVEAYNNLARTFLAAGQAEQALDTLQRALAIRETPDSKTLLVQCVRGLQSPPDTDGFRALLVRAMSEPWGRASELAPAAAKLIKLSKTTGACIRRAADAWPRRLPAEEMFGAAGFAAVADDRLLRCLLESTTIADIDLERFLTSVRFALLRAVRCRWHAAGDDQALTLACALARQCFINEQVFALTDEEAPLRSSCASG